MGHGAQKNTISGPDIIARHNYVWPRDSAHNDPYGPRLLWNAGRVLRDETLTNDSLACCWFQCVGHRQFGRSKRYSSSDEKWSLA